MANWANPTLTSLYTDFLNQLKERDTDLALQFDGTTSTSLTTGTIRWDSTANRWKKWSGSAWAELATTYALTGLSTTGNATIGGTLGVTGATTLAAATATTPATGDTSTAVATTAWVRNQAYATLASPALTGTPTAPTAAVGTNTTQVATTAYVNAEISNDAILKTGGTMTGLLVLSGDPTDDLNAVTRRWVEALPAKRSVRVATTAALTATATTSTLTNSGTLAALTIDGISLSAGDRVLVKDQAATAANGVYTVTTAGSGAVAWVLTRATDADLWTDIVAAVVPVEEGTVNDNNIYICRAARGGTLGTTAITWQLASSSLLENATALNTASMLVRRDAGGSFATTSFTLEGTGASVLNVGSTAQRPTGATGMVRFNNTIAQFEGYNGTAWGTIGGGATGGAGDQVFIENGQTVTATYTLSAGKNAVSAGPVTISNGVVVTIPSGATWVVV